MNKYENEQDLKALIEDFLAAQKPVAAVCHAPAVLLKAKNADGEPLVKGKKVTGFSNSEEAAVELTAPVGGTVVSIAPSAEVEDFGRVVRVKTQFPNEEGFFRPEMTGFAKIDGAEMKTWEAFTRLFVRFFLIEVWGWIP